ncbi:MAG: hypothetical protein V4692_14565 [Bdellovibrionota bacterium]
MKLKITVTLAVLGSVLFGISAEAVQPSITELAAYTAGLPKITLSGTCDNQVSTIFVDEVQAREMLPSTLELVSEPYFPAGQHPLQIMFQVTSDLKLVGSPFPKFPAYNEVILAVRNVRVKGGKGKIYDYYKKLYLDSILPVVLGYYVGFPKHFGQFDRGETFFTARSTSGKPVANVKFEKKTEYDREAFAKNFELLRQTTPVQEVIADGYGKLVCSKFTFDWATATAYPIDATWDVFDKLHSSASGTYQMPGFDQTPFGGLGLKASWTLVGPLPCE